MKRQAKYSIGDMSRICQISKKALRYYDKIGLISSHRQDYNNYRYYTQEALLAVPVIKFYKQMGFTLEEMKGFIEGDDPNVYRTIQKSFLSKIAALERSREVIRRQYISVKDWYDLVFEAEMVIDNNIHEVSVKYVEPLRLLYQEQAFANDIKAAVINIDFTNFVESLGNEITGPVMIHFSSCTDRMRDKEQLVRIMQKALRPCPEDATIRFGGCMMAACYHIGPHETLVETYTKLTDWVTRHGYVPGEGSYERYVTDYWTTRNSAQFVTEVMLQVTRQDSGA